jgi:hypothetical protein
VAALPWELFLIFFSFLDSLFYLFPESLPNKTEGLRICQAKTGLVVSFYN